MFIVIIILVIYLIKCQKEKPPRVTLADVDIYKTYDDTNYIVYPASGTSHRTPSADSPQNPNPSPQKDDSYFDKSSLSKFNAQLRNNLKILPPTKPEEGDYSTFIMAKEPVKIDTSSSASAVSAKSSTFDTTGAMGISSVMNNLKLFKNFIMDLVKHPTDTIQSMMNSCINDMMRNGSFQGINLGLLPVIPVMQGYGVKMDSLTIAKKGDNSILNFKIMNKVVPSIETGGSIMTGFIKDVKFSNMSFSYTAKLPNIVFTCSIVDSKKSVLLTAIIHLSVSMTLSAAADMTLSLGQDSEKNSFFGITTNSPGFSLGFDVTKIEATNFSISVEDVTITEVFKLKNPPSPFSDNCSMGNTMCSMPDSKATKWYKSLPKGRKESDFRTWKTWGGIGNMRYAEKCDTLCDDDDDTDYSIYGKACPWVNDTSMTSSNGMCKWNGDCPPDYTDHLGTCISDESMKVAEVKTLATALGMTGGVIQKDSATSKLASFIVDHIDIEHMIKTVLVNNLSNLCHYQTYELIDTSVVNIDFVVAIDFKVDPSVMKSK